MPRLNDFIQYELTASFHIIIFTAQTVIRITEADLHPMFVQVALLLKGDCFVRASTDFSRLLMIFCALSSHAKNTFFLSDKMFATW